MPWPSSANAVWQPPDDYHEDIHDHVDHGHDKEDNDLEKEEENVKLFGKEDPLNTIVY